MPESCSLTPITINEASMGEAGGGNRMGIVVGEFVLLRLTLHNGGKTGRNLISSTLWLRLGIFCLDKLFVCWFPCLLLGNLLGCQRYNIWIFWSCITWNNWKYKYFQKDTVLVLDLRFDQFVTIAAQSMAEFRNGWGRTLARFPLQLTLLLLWVEKNTTDLLPLPTPLCWPPTMWQTRKRGGGK